MSEIEIAWMQDTTVENLIKFSEPTKENILNDRDTNRNKNKSSAKRIKKTDIQMHLLFVRSKGRVCVPTENSRMTKKWVKQKKQMLLCDTQTKNNINLILVKMCTAMR